jgi:hypothetical protein
LLVGVEVSVPITGMGGLATNQRERERKREVRII